MVSEEGDDEDEVQDDVEEYDDDESKDEDLGNDDDDDIEKWRSSSASFDDSHVHSIHQG